MKNLVLLFTILASSLSFSQVVRPQIYTFSNFIQVVTTNDTDEDYRCSGYVYANTRSGKVESHFVFDVIYRGMTSYRNFYITDFRDAYMSSYSNIFCTAY